MKTHRAGPDAFFQQSGRLADGRLRIHADETAAAQQAVVVTAEEALQIRREPPQGTKEFPGPHHGPRGEDVVRKQVRQEPQGEAGAPEQVRENIPQIYLEQGPPGLDEHTVSREPEREVLVLAKEMERQQARRNSRPSHCFPKRWLKPQSAS